MSTGTPCGVSMMIVSPFAGLKHGISMQGGDPTLTLAIRTLTEFLLHSALEEVHHEIFAMHENDILRLALPNQLRDAFGISMGRERHVMHLHLRFDLFAIEHEPALTEKQFRPDGIRHAVTRNDNLAQRKRMPMGQDDR